MHLTHDSFVMYKDISATGIFQPKADQIPREWASILKPNRDWLSPTAESGHAMVSRWQWLKHWAQHDAETLPPDASWLSGVVPPLALLHRAPDDYMLSLGGSRVMTTYVRQRPICESDESVGLHLLVMCGWPIGCFGLVVDPRTFFNASPW
jgi:hypothetical protein